MIHIRENVHQVGSILFVTNFLNSQLAIASCGIMKFVTNNDTYHRNVP